jgi:hypothetical protein
MTAAGDPFASLPRSIRTWLDAFSSQVDALTIDQLQLLAVQPFGEERDRARERAAELARRTSRGGALDAVRQVAEDYLTKRYSRLFSDPRRPFLGNTSSLRTGAVDRARLVGSFEDALVAIALSDVLEPADVDALLGTWADLADGPAAR